MSKRTPGLQKRGKYWHIKKTIYGRRTYESTGESELEGAERYLRKRIEEIRKSVIYKERIDRTFIEAATKYANEATKKSFVRDAVTIKAAVPYIGDMPLNLIHQGSIEPFIDGRKKDGIKNLTINRDIAVIRRILTLAARVWRDENGKSWLDQAPLFQMLPDDSRKPYPISWDEQTRLLAELPGHLADMVLFAVNTGLREKELTGLRWDEEGVDGNFLIPSHRCKTKIDRIVPLNLIARRIVNAQRGRNEKYVFTYQGNSVKRINGHAWRNARTRSGLEQCRVHDLRHTFGSRLRAAGASYEDRQDLLGHKSSRMTTHYSRPEIDNLVACVEKLCGARNGIQTPQRFESVR